MSALAKASAALAKKGEESLSLRKEMAHLKTLQEAGILGCLSITIVGVSAVNTLKAIDDVVIQYSHGESPDNRILCKIMEKFTVNLTTKDSTIQFSGSYNMESDDKREDTLISDTNEDSSSSNGSSFSFNAVFDCKEAPEDTSLTFDLETAEQAVNIRMQVIFDSCDSLLAGKTTEWEQAENARKELGAAVREISSGRQEESESPSRKVSRQQSPKKASSKTASSSSQGTDEKSSIFSSVDKLYKSTMANISGAQDMLIHSRAYWLFAAASITIYYFGEYASI